MAWEPSPLARAGLLLFSVAVVGVLIGVGVESSLPDEDRPLVQLPTGASDESGPAPIRSSGPTAEERAITQRATAGLPPYKDAVPQALSSDFLDPGSPIAAAWFATPDKPDDVLAYYKHTFEDAGIPTVQQRYNANAGYVGYMEPHTEVVHLISAIAQGGETTVFVSTGKVASFVAGQEEQPVPEGLPMPPEVSKPVVLTFHQEGRVRYSVMAEVEVGEASDMAAFYRHAFESQGWRIESTSSEDPLQTQLTASRDGSRATAMTSQQGAGVRLYLTLDRRE